MTESEHIPRGFILFIYILTFVIGVPSNILAFWTFARKVHRKPTPIDILLLNLTISDLIFLAFLPFKMKEAVDETEWHLPYYLCPISGFMFYATIYTSILFLTAVSVERYLSVAHPMRYMNPGRTLYVALACVAFWIFSLAHCSVVFVIQLSNHTHVSNVTKCYKDFADDQLRVLLPVRLEMFLVFFLIPFGICCFCYINFIRILSKMPKISQHRYQRAIGMALGTLVVFTLCFGPYNFSHVYGFIEKKDAGWRGKALLLSTLNAGLDPIIFYFSSSDVRNTLRLCLKESFNFCLRKKDKDLNLEASDPSKNTI